MPTAQPTSPKPGGCFDEEGVMTTTISQPSRGGRMGLAHHIGGTNGSVGHRDRKYWGSTMNRRRDHWTPRVPVFGRDVSEPLRGVGGLFLMSVDAVRFLFRRPFQAREFLEQSSMRWNPCSFGRFRSWSAPGSSPG